MLPTPPAPPFVKVCGFTDPANLRAICEADVRPDAVGLNFWPGSKRHVTDELADELVRASFSTPPGAPAVDVWGVFVDADGEHLAETCHWAALEGLQLHGDEPPAGLTDARHATGEGTGGAVVRGWRVAGLLDPLLAHLAAVDEEYLPDAVLLDAAVPGAYGGTGAKLDWHALRGELDRVGDRLPPVILAGGLTPENVAEAVRIVRPWGVDVAGGVERSPGVKDPAKVRAFIENARPREPEARFGLTLVPTAAAFVAVAGAADVLGQRPQVGDFLLRLPQRIFR